MNPRLALATLFLSVTAATADPPSRNNVNLTDKSLPSEWSAGKAGKKNVKWVTEVGTRGYVTPVVAGGKIYVATDNGKRRDPAVKGDRAVLMCFEEATGKFLWQIAHDMPPPEFSPAGGTKEGLFSTPAVEGGRLYYLTPAAVVVCAGTDGKVVWTLDLMKEHKVQPNEVAYSSPLVVGDLVFLVTGHGRPSADPDTPADPAAPSFVAVNKKTGKLAWKDSSPGKNIMEGQWTSPAHAAVGGKGQVIFPGGDGWLYAFEPETGKPVWKFDGNPKDAEWKPHGKGTKSYFFAPVVVGDRLYTGIGQNPENGVDVGHLWCVDITKTGDLSKEMAKGKPNPNSGVVWHFGGPAPAGSKRDFVFGRTICAPVVHDGLLYVPELDGFLHCLDAKTGQPLWEEDLKASVWASPLWADGKVYVADDSGYVHVFAHGKAKRVLAKVEMDEPMKATPVAANGMLYFLGDKRLYAISAK